MENSAYDSNGSRKYLSVDEGLAFMRATEELTLLEQTFCQILYYTGCRISEALNLSLDSLDMGEKVARIQTLKKRNQPETRRIPLPCSLVSQFESLRTNTKPARIWTMSRSTSWRLVKRTMRLASIQGIQATPKGLRHGFGVRSVLANVPITTIQKWMGHSHIETTSIYLDVKDDEERAFMKRTWMMPKESIKAPEQQS